MTSSARSTGHTMHPPRALCQLLESRCLLSVIPYRWAGERDPQTPIMSGQQFGYWFDMAPSAANDKFTVVGEYSRETQLYRYLRNGTPDSSFGSGTGKVTVDLTYNSETAGQLIVLPDDSIIIGGNGDVSSGSSQRQSFLAKFTSTGAPDLTFGTGGIVRFVNVEVGFNTFERLSTGKYFAVGGNSAFRFNANGSLDSTFGTNGSVTLFPGDSQFSRLEDALVLPNDRFYVAGSHATLAGDGAIARVARFLPNGQPDLTFNGNGVLEFDLNPGTWDEVQALARQGDRVILGIETDYTQSSQHHELTEIRRIESDGTFDTQFANAPGGVLDTSSRTKQVHDVEVDAQQRILVSGYTTTILRLSSDGAYDPQFGYQSGAIDSYDNVQLLTWPNGDIFARHLQTTTIVPVLGAPRGDGPVYLDPSDLQLYITGTPADQTFVVETVGDELHVTIDGVQSAFPLSQVSNLTLDARLGYDQITYDVHDDFAGVTNTLDHGPLSPANTSPTPADGRIRILSGPIDGTLMIGRQTNYGGEAIVEPGASVDLTSSIPVTLIGTEEDDLFDSTSNVTTGVGSIVHNNVTADARGGNDSFIVRSNGGGTFLGGEGDDTLDIKTGTASFSGGAGFDQILIAPTSTTATNNANVGLTTVSITGSTASNLSGIELVTMSGGTGRDTLRITTVAPGLSIHADFGDNDDTLSLDLFTSTILNDGAIVFDGGAGSDVVNVQGRSFLPDQIRFDAGVIGYGAGAGSIQSVSYANMESLMFNGRQGLETVAIDGGLPVRMTPFQDFDLLSITDGGVGQLASLARARQISIAPGGLLDMQNSAALLIDYTGASPIGTTQALINSGRNGGAWNGSTGITSTPARLAPAHNTTLALMESTDYKSIYGQNATYFSLPLDDSAVLVKYTYYGDADFNGIVNFDDYSRIDNGFTLHTTGWSNGDSDGNGSVNFDDYSLIDLAFNTQGPPLVKGNQG